MAVSRQQVWAPVLALVTDLQCCAVLSLAGVVRTNQLKQTRFSTFGVCAILHLSCVYNSINNSFFGCRQLNIKEISTARKLLSIQFCCDLLSSMRGIFLGQDRQ